MIASKSLSETKKIKEEKERILRIKGLLRKNSFSKDSREGDIANMLKDTEDFENNSLQQIPNYPTEKDKLGHYILYNLGKYMIETNDNLIDFWLTQNMRGIQSGSFSEHNFRGD